MTGNEAAGLQELGAALGIGVRQASTMMSDPPQYEVMLRIYADLGWHRFSVASAAQLYILAACVRGLVTFTSGEKED